MTDAEYLVFAAEMSTPTFEPHEDASWAAGVAGVEARDPTGATLLREWRAACEKVEAHFRRAAQRGMS